MTARAGDIELHATASSARLLDRPFAVTLRTLPRPLGVSIAMAVSTNVAPSNIELHHPAADRRPERHVDLVFKIAARLRTLIGHLAAAAASEDAGKNILEPPTSPAGSFSAAGASAFKEIGEVKAAEIDVALSAGRPATREASRKVAGPGLSAAARIRVRGSRIDVVGIKPKLIVNLPLFRIAEDVIRLGKSLELFLGSFVARIYIRMILAGKLAKRLANVVDGRRLLYPKNAVIIFIFGLGGHGLAVSHHLSEGSSSRAGSKDPYLTT